MPCLTESQVTRLTEPFSKEEIKEAVFQIRPLKALGVDGKPAYFYQRYWYIKGQDTVNAVFGFLVK